MSSKRPKCSSFYFVKQVKLMLKGTVCQRSRSLAAGVSSLLLAAMVGGKALGADWGYDDGKSSASTPAAGAAASPAPHGARKTSGATAKNGPSSARAPAGGNLFSRGATAGATHRASVPLSAAEGEQDTASGAGDQAQALNDWIQIYELVSKEPLTDEQRARFKKSLRHKLSTAGGTEVLSVVNFWPRAKREMAANAELAEPYAALFRALLRFQSKSKNLAAEDGEILPEVLGLERIAVPGTPALAEESIDAYADMACFMYEQRHPGKTVDAIDNRTIFAASVCNNFRNAPTESAKKAMSNFALTWSKFRIAWAAAGQGEREQLLSSLESGAKPPDELMSKTVDKIIRSGPWFQSKL